ncbi:sensor histidine kinase [Undibacterium sp. Ji67W]|uniref:sensor histidine kinase n=1 Tax=Undibacterium sp. Ji67W TaxID=3413042 RepID=UPI003BF05E99
MTANAAVLQIGHDTGKLALQSRFEVFEDKSGKLNLSDLLQPTIEQQFTPLPGNLRAEYSPSAYWLKLELLRENSNAQKDWLVEMTPVMLDDIRLFHMDANGKVEVHKAGDHLPFSQYEIHHHYPLFQIHIDDTKVHTLYFRIQSTSSVFFRATLFDQKNFTEESNFLSGMIGIFYGIMLAMIIYNSLLMVSYRDISMFHYLMLSISTLVAGLSVNGHIGLYFAQNWPWLVDILPNVMPRLIVLSSSMFMCSFLKLKTTLPLANKLFRFVQLNIVLFLVLTLAGHQPELARFGQYLGLIQICLFFPVSLLVALRGYTPGYIVLLASTAWISGTILIPLRNLGFIESSWLSDFGFQIGAAIEVILLALAQAYKISLIRTENVRVQKQLLKISQQAEYELEAKVRLRTNELNEVVQRLKKTDKEKNDFLSIAAHDLKSPLTSIIGMSELLLQMYHRIPKEQQQNYLSRINASGKRMMHIVTDLLDVNAMESGDLHLQKTELDLGKLLNDIALQYEEMLKAKDLTAIIHVEESVIVLADINAMTRIMDNLISNAIKFSPAGKFIWLTVSQYDEMGRFEVRDQGPGLSTKDQQFLFTKFSKLSAVPTAGEHSSGLGLSIVKKLIEAQNGVVNCVSAVGEGACFSIDLPLDKNVSQQAIAVAA